jgi:predicted DNA-binding transcriptional regulator AlpA
MDLNDAKVITLPAEAERHRILGAKQAAAFWGLSLPHWRRLYQTGRVPAPIKIGERKVGWRMGDLIDALDARAKGAKRNAA